jgi:hypothetical protein
MAERERDARKAKSQRRKAAKEAHREYAQQNGFFRLVGGKLVPRDSEEALTVGEYFDRLHKKEEAERDDD